MNASRICLLVLTVSLLTGCRPGEPREVKVAEPAARKPTSTTLTLSPEQLMSLDWDGRLPGRPVVVNKQIVAGGVEFDIRLPGSPGTTSSIDYASSGSGGRRTLIGINVGRYRAFALKFTLLSVAGQDKANLPHRVAVGALIGPAGDGRSSACEMVTLGFAPDLRARVATTGMSTETVRVIGIHAQVANPAAWGAKDNVLRLRVEPAPDADVLVPPAPPVKERKPRQPPKYMPDFGPGGTKAW